MSFVLDAFQVYLHNISLPDSQIESAQRSTNALRNYLANDPYFGRLMLGTFLNGSYARHTVVQPIKDVDVILVVRRDGSKRTLLGRWTPSGANSPIGTRTGEHGGNGGLSRSHCLISASMSYLLLLLMAWSARCESRTVSCAAGSRRIRSARWSS